MIHILRLDYTIKRLVQLPADPTVSVEEQLLIWASRDEEQLLAGIFYTCGFVRSEFSVLSGLSASNLKVNNRHISLFQGTKLVY
jgi:hypothetical protein